MSFTSDKIYTSINNLNYISYQDIYIDSDIDSYPDCDMYILDTDSLSNSSKISYDDEIHNKYLQNNYLDNKSFDIDNFSISSSISDTNSVYNTIHLDSHKRNMYDKKTCNTHLAIYDRIEYKKNMIEKNTYFNKEFYQIMFNYIIFNSK